MEVKEVIEFLKEWNKFKPYRNSAMNITQLNKTMDSVIDLLQQGEAYEAIVGELIDLYCNGERVTHIEFDKIKQKYFPKEIINEKFMRRKLENELDDLWREIIYLKFNYTCEMCGLKMTPEECHAHHIIPRGNFNVRWCLENGSLLCNYNHNAAENAPHHDNGKYLEWLKDHRWKGHYGKLLRKSGEKGGADKCTILELMQLRSQLKEIKEYMEEAKAKSRQSMYTERYYHLETR